MHTFCSVKNVELSRSHLNDGLTFIRNSYYTKKTTAVQFIFSSIVDFLPSDVFTEFPNTNGLYLTSSTLPAITTDLFSEHFMKLEYLNFESNNIREIQEKSLDILLNLRWIYLGWNQIETLEQNVFHLNTKLEYIALMNNRIKQIQPKFMESLQKLQEIWFGKNLCVDQNFGCPWRCSEKKMVDQLLQTCYDNYFRESSEQLVLNSNGPVDIVIERVEIKKDKEEIATKEDTLTNQGVITIEFTQNVDGEEESIPKNSIEELNHHFQQSQKSTETRILKNITDSITILRNEYTESFRNLSLGCEVELDTFDYRIGSLQRKFSNSSIFLNKFHQNFTRDSEKLNSSIQDSLKLEAWIKQIIEDTRYSCNMGILSLNESFIEGQLYYINEIQILKHESKQNVKLVEQKLGTLVTKEEFERFSKDSRETFESQFAEMDERIFNIEKSQILLEESQLNLQNSSSEFQLQMDSLNTQIGNFVTHQMEQQDELRSLKENIQQFSGDLELVKKKSNEFQSILQNMAQKILFLEKMMELEQNNRQLVHKNEKLVKEKDELEQRIQKLETEFTRERESMKNTLEFEFNSKLEANLNRQKLEMEENFNEKLISQMKMFNDIYEHQKETFERNENALLAEIDKRKIMEENYSRELLMTIRKQNEILEGRLQMDQTKDFDN